MKYRREAEATPTSDVWGLEVYSGSALETHQRLLKGLQETICKHKSCCQRLERGNKQDTEMGRWKLREDQRQMKGEAETDGHRQG